LFLEQEIPEGGKFWEFPFRAALADKQGNDLAEVMEPMKGKEKKIVFTDVEKPAFLSLNRGYSFFLEKWFMTWILMS
jgi:aminopeptidase N